VTEEPKSEELLLPAMKRYGGERKRNPSRLKNFIQQRKKHSLIVLTQPKKEGEWKKMEKLLHGGKPWVVITAITGR